MLSTGNRQSATVKSVEYDHGQLEPYPLLAVRYRYSQWRYRCDVAELPDTDHDWCCSL